MNLLILVLFGSTLFSQNVEEIIRKADDLYRGKSNKAQLEMQVIKPDWSRTFEMKSWALGNDYSLIYIMKPKKDKGTVTLKRHNEIWNYLPKIKREIKIPSSMMMQSWMGSDFNNDDLVKESSILDDYDKRIIGEKEISGHLCYVIELKPNAKAAVVWEKIITYITKADYLTLQNEYYDEDNEMIKKMILSDIKVLGGRKMPTRLEMIPMDKENQKTVMIYKNIEFDIDISESFFSKKNMRKVN